MTHTRMDGMEKLDRWMAGMGRDGGIFDGGMDEWDWVDGQWMDGNGIDEWATTTTFAT